MRKNNILTALCILILTNLISCTGASLPAPTKTPQSTNTITQSFTPTFTLTPTQTPSVTATFTHIPTLQPEEEKANILGLLSSNGGCKLPCWWGITPGETTRSEVEALSGKYNLRLDEYPNGFSRSIWVNFQEGLMQGIIEAGMENNFIKYLSISAEYLSNSSSKAEDFKNSWSFYAPEKLIPVLGVPTRILIDITPGPSEGSRITYLRYDLYVVYDNKGIRLTYSVKNDLTADRYKICPVFGRGGNTEAMIGILLASPTDTVPIETYDNTNIQDQRAIPIEKAAGVTLKDFYNLYMQPGKPACFHALPHILPGY